jgi:hypothetical protein
MKHVLVELDTGEQEFFESAYEGFKYAKEQEDKRRHSVDYIAIGDFYKDEGIIYKGQSLRLLLRSLDSVQDWLRATHFDSGMADTQPDD